MSTVQLIYRGVSYGIPHDHSLPSGEPVEHVYRGVHYSMALKHEPQPVDESLELHYRGQIYHHRQQQARLDLQTG